MAKHAARENEPSEENMKSAVAGIEGCYSDLLAEKMAYMSRCKKIREIMAGEYDHASDHGISKKLLKTIIKERDLERKIAALTDDLEDDERSEFEMLASKLGEFANTPLGSAAMSKVKQSGTDVLSSVGA